MAALRLMKLDMGQPLFVNGGSSAVGISTIQIAKLRGLRVVATASGKNKDFLLGLGVDEFIDYIAGPLAERLKKNPPSPLPNAFFDAVGLTDPTLYLNCGSYITPGGNYITAGTLPKGAAEWKGMTRQVIEGVLRPTWLGGVPRKLGAVTSLKHSDLKEISELVANGCIKPIVDSVHSFDREGVMGAYKRLMTKRAVGKVVVRVADE